jgi:membrane protease YdiL (CAAX protease family)
MESRGRARGTFLTVVGVLCALAVVALAARGGVSAGAPGSRRPADALLDTVISLLIVALAVGIVAVVALFVLNRDVFRSLPEPLRRRRSSRRTIVAVLVFVLALSLLVRYAGQRTGELELPELRQPPAAETLQDEAASESRYDPEFAWLPVLVVLALATAGVGAAWWSARARRRARGGEPETFAEALDDVLAETLDDLRAEADPRRAVIAAYARLERLLGAYGVPRRPAEAPLEFLSRALVEAEVGPVAVERLTSLFERARFSQHEVGPEMKEEAIDALETVREDLRLAELRAREALAEALALQRERAAS